MIDGVTPASFKPAQINGILWPTGLMPKLANNVPDMALSDRFRSWALQHNLGQAWAQIGRSPAGHLVTSLPHWQHLCC